jgi:DNA repair ATPase RecN
MESPLFCKVSIVSFILFNGEAFMTQEELDALMSGELDDISQDEDAEYEESADLDTLNDEEDILNENPDEDLSDVTLPPPATKENKMVHQLDDVTKESEEKAIEIFDIIEVIGSDLVEQEESLNYVLDVINSNVELFSKLSKKFPDVEAFKDQLQKNESSLNKINETIETLQNSGDSIMSVMDIMQYQDIHRQKIERVISKYMNTLFEGKMDDDKRVSSAQHIAGDAHNEIASTEDIEALLEQFGNK